MLKNVLDVEQVCSLHVTSFKTLWLNLRLPERVDRQELVRGTYSGPLPLLAQVWKRRRIGDLIETTWASLRVISGRFRRVLEDAELTGWRTFPVVVEDYAPEAALICWPLLANADRNTGLAVRAERGCLRRVSSWILEIRRTRERYPFGATQVAHAKRGP